MTISQKEFEVRSNEERREGFRRWMQEPMTRALVSMIPPCEQIEVLLQAAFEAGHANGSVSATISFLDYVMKPSR